MASEHTHKGHRERLKSRFLQQGLGFDIFFYCTGIPPK